MKIRSKYFHLLKPRYIIAITIVIAIIMVVSAFLELSQSREELYHLLTEQGISLIETITISGGNTLLSSSEIENLIAERLLTAGRMIARLDSISNLKQDDLKKYATENNIFRINIFDKNGNIVLSNHTAEPEQIKSASRHLPVDFIKPILENKERELIIGLKEAHYQDGVRFTVAVKRAKNRQGAIVLNVDATYLLEIRKKIGLGKILQDIGDNDGVEYIFLQDDEGIIAASKSITEAEPIEEDSFLSNAYLKDTLQTRVYSQNNKDVFEVVKSFTVNNEKIGMVRLGLSMDEIHSLEQRMVRRSVIISVVLLVILVIVIAIIFINQNLQLVSKEYSKIQTYTGSILQNMADGVITTDANGNITIFNRSAQEICSATKDEIVGKNLSQILNGQLTVISDSLMNRKPLKNYEFQVTCNQRQKVFSVDTSFVYEKDEKLDSFTVVLRDITEVKAMERQIQQREKLVAMGELASGVAHEIRNPLNSIHMIAQRYEKEFIPEKGTEDYLSITKVLKSEVQRVNNIIQQFLRFARPPKLNIIQYSSKVLINELELLLRPEVDSKGIKLEINVHDDVMLDIDKDQMKQALLNLLRNSIEATPMGGKISFNFRRENSKGIFVVKDTGMGIPPEQIDKIFNLYYSTKPSGTGIGLSIVQQIISQHDGYIFVESKPGQGTKFTIEIPINKEMYV